MTLTNEQAATIKEQLLKQVNQLPEQQRNQAKEYIKSMNNQQLEEFLKQNKLAQESQSGEAKQAHNGNQCVFCALANKKMESFTIYEDKGYLAALEINPFSKGHTILIPKKHIKETKSIPSRAFTVANRIGKHLVKKLKAQSFQINTAAEMNHAIINIIPVYKDQPLTFERQKTDKKELQENAIKIGEVAKRATPVIKIGSKVKATSKKGKESSIIKLQRRIP